GPETGGDVFSEGVDGLELGRLAGPLVGDLGQHLLLDVLDEDLEGSILLLPRRRGVELEDVARLGAPQLVVELGHDGAAADLVEEVVGGEALDLGGVAVAVEIDGDVIAGAGGTGELAQIAEL